MLIKQGSHLANFVDIFEPAGITTVLLRVNKTKNLRSIRAIDLTPLQTFRQLSHLWIFGYPN